jgi:hypothetical protein
MTANFKYDGVVVMVCKKSCLLEICDKIVTEENDKISTYQKKRMLCKLFLISECMSPDV